jgi:hypothetical protein
VPAVTYTQRSAETRENREITDFEAVENGLRSVTMRSALLILLLGLAACGDWPDDGGPPMARSAQDWPDLLPLDALLESGTVPAASDSDANALRNRAAALRNRAAILRSDSSDLDALRARLNR